MHQLFKLSAAIVLMTAYIPAFAAGDPAAGEKKAMLCSSCHGVDGIGIGPLWPNLAGQKEAYLIKQMHDFRDGKRLEPMMQAFIEQLNDEDIDNLANYYSQLGSQ